GGTNFRTSGSPKTSSIAAASAGSNDRISRRCVSTCIGRETYALGMADVVPFHGLRLPESKAGPLADLISPPYDVISDRDRVALYARSPHNIVRVEEGIEEPGDTA